MSVQFGRWNFDGKPCVPEYVEKVGTMLAPYGPDSNETYSKSGVQILYRAFHITKESRREKQPHVIPSGLVVTWDGQLDNRADLIESLRNLVSASSTDIEIVGAAFERWGENCLGKLIGDWALSTWNPHSRSLLLAKDPIGTRPLYYTIQRDCIVWCSTLDPLVLLAEKPFELCEEYVAGWYSSHPATHVTPYSGIQSVPPSSLVTLKHGKHTVSKFWDFDPEPIRYRTDGEYEEHFRSVFTNAVRRKLRSDSPVLAELSGGRDSSSIVCVADTVLAEGTADCPRLDTLSCYDDSEPNWNERPYFSKIEEKRGRTGWHINVQDSETSVESEPKNHGYVPAPNYPGYDGRTSPTMGACLTAQGNRVILSGIGGDETMGGVPTPVPELADLFASGRLGQLAHQLKVWALEQKKPWIHLFWETVRDFLPVRLTPVPNTMKPAPWLASRFAKRHWAALHGYPTKSKFFGSLPSFQGNVSTINALQRQLGQSALPFDPPYDKRYPFLDRSLLEFMFAIPREQLVRPKQRRSLMRRALAGIVPDEILNKKGKAFVERAPLVGISREWAKLTEVTQNMISSALGIVDSARFVEALQQARNGQEAPIISLTRTLFIEGWLKVLAASGLVNIDPGRRLAWQASEYRQQKVAAR